MINSQLSVVELLVDASISKGMGDQFSAIASDADGVGQYIKGDG